MTTTVTLKGKQFGAASSEIPEDLAKKLYAKKGTTLLAIVEIKSDKTHESLDGDRQVDTVITSFEPVIDGDLNGQVSDIVRNLHRALNLNRTRISAAGDEALPLDDNEPTVEGVKAAAAALVETDDAGNVTGLWDGNTDPDADELPAPPEDDTDDGPEDEDLAGDQLADPAYDDEPPADAHIFAGTGELCDDCGHRRADPVHAEVPAPA